LARRVEEAGIKRAKKERGIRKKREFAITKARRAESKRIKEREKLKRRPKAQRALSKRIRRTERLRKKESLALRERLRKKQEARKKPKRIPEVKVVAKKEIILPVQERRTLEQALGQRFERVGQQAGRPPALKPGDPKSREQVFARLGQQLGRPPVPRQRLVQKQMVKGRPPGLKQVLAQKPVLKPKVKKAQVEPTKIKEVQQRAEIKRRIKSTWTLILS
ncbi:hypothetical protein LCGC14_2687340, partial [marine sediment metagenome]